MRIAFIVTEFPTLSETFVLNQITGLVDRGHDVDIFAGSSDFTQKMHPDVLKYNLVDKTYSLSPPKDKVRRLLKSVYLIASNFYKAPLVIVDSLNVFKHGKEAASLRKLYKATLFRQGGGYSILLCHFGPNGLMAVSLRELGSIKSKIVTVFHGYDVSEYIKLNGDHVYDTLFMKGDLFLPISEYWKEILIGLGCNGDRIVVHHMGVDCERLNFRVAKYDKSLPIKILTIGRLVEKKGVEYGIHAVARLCRKYNLEYNIIGSGPLMNRCEATIAEFNVQNKIRLLGAKDSAEVHKMLNRSHIFLCPSVTDEGGNKEGIPVVLMEAMATGLPVLSTWHSGIPELVKDGVSGFLVPERDVDALEEKLIYLIEHPEKWAAMGRAGRDLVERHFDINKLNDQLIKIFQKLLENN